MTDDVLFYNDLGRQGKSTLAYNYFDYQKRRGISPKYVTNDMENISFPVKKLVGEDNLVSVAAGEEISIDTDDHNIFDFGGYLDSRVVDVAGFVKCVIVPITYISNSELKITVKTIKALMDYSTTFGIPVTVSTDGASVFTSKAMKEFCRKWDIFQRVSLPSSLK